MTRAATTRRTMREGDETDPPRLLGALPVPSRPIGISVTKRP